MGNSVSLTLGTFLSFVTETEVYFGAEADPCVVVFLTIIAFFGRGDHASFKPPIRSSRVSMTIS